MLRAAKPARILVDGRRFYPTVVPLPLWASSRILSTRFQLTLEGIRVRSLRDEMDLTGLMRPSFAPHLPATLNPREYLASIRREGPVDGKEIVDWMHLSYTDNAILSARMDEYNRLGSQVIGMSNDPFTPGTYVEDCSFRSEYGKDVSARGYGIAQTPRGNFNVGSGGRQTGAFRDLLTWGGIPWTGYSQWTGILLKWKSLASTPVTSTVGFPTGINPMGGFLSAPQFVVMSPSRPALRVSVSEVFSCGAAERLNIIYRDPNDFTRVLANDWADLPAGQSELNYTIISFPYVPPVAHEIQPQDNITTALNRFTTSP